MIYYKEIDFINKFDVDLILKELDMIIQKYNLHEKWNNINQISLVNFEENTNDVFAAVGSLNSDWSKATFENGILKAPKRVERKTEADAKYLCKQFKHTIFEEIYDELLTHYKVGRVRIMRSKPKTCLSWHTDSTNRLHYPLKTQEGCFMLFDGEVVHLEKGKWIMTYTNGNHHTAFNASTEDRIHLVASIL